MTLQELLASVAADLDPDIDYRALLCSGGYRTPNAIKQAGNVDQIQQACGLLPGDADVIWNAAGGVAAEIKSLDPDPLDTERIASGSDYSTGDNITPAEAQLQTIIVRNKQRVLPLYWPYEECLQSAVLQSLKSAEHGLGRDAFRAHNLRVRCDTESDGHITGITEVGILEFKRVEGPAELKIARYCMSKMREMRDESNELYLRSFMPMATCEVVGSELRFGAVWFESSLCATHFECIDMRLNASLMHERRVAVAIAGWMQLLLHLDTAARKIFATAAQGTTRLALLRKGCPYVLWDMDSNCQGVEEVVPRKLYKAWSRDDQAMVALKLVEVYGFEAASAWADQHVAVPSSLVRILPGGYSVVSMPWLHEDQGWYILGDLTAVQLERDRVWLAIQEMLGRAHAPFLQHSDDGQVSEARYVHGDLRLRNLAAKYVEGQITSVIMLDLDWAGMHGTQVYLADINPSIAPFTQRPTGVQRGAVMLQTHDLQTIQSEYKAKVCEHLVDTEAN